MGYIFDALNRMTSSSSTPAVENNNAPSPLKPSAFAAQAHFAKSSPLNEADDLDQPINFANAVRLADETPLKVDDRLVMITEPATIMAEEYRAIRTGILARWDQKRHLTHTITSATPQEGKTISSLNLGLCFAELHNRSTIVIECDLRLPQFEKLLNIPSGPGMVDHLSKGTPLDKVIYRPPGSQLHVIAAGQRAGNETVQLLSSQTMVDLLAKLRKHYDHIIIDTPPVVELADAGILGAMSDDVLLVARMGQTPRTLVEQAIRTLQSYNAPVAGLIATDQVRPRRQAYYHRYGYHYPYAQYSQAA